MTTLTILLIAGLCAVVLLYCRWVTRRERAPRPLVGTAAAHPLPDVRSRDAR